MSDRDYYEVLGLTPAADGAMVDQAYWHLARKYQALATTNPRASQMLDELNEAYGVIGSSKLREQYDGFRDDVLISKGIIQPVKSKSRRGIEVQSKGTAARPRLLWLTSRFRAALRGPWRMYAAAGLPVVLVAAGLWQGMALISIGAAAAIVLAIWVVPALVRRSATASRLAATPQELLTTAARVPERHRSRALRTAATPPVARKPDTSSDELQASTAAMISRWRHTIGLRPPSVREGVADTPSSTLVDIVESERGLDEQSEPLSAVIDILRGAQRTPKYR